ncbi:MAG: hypothetical protein JW788_06060 [Candidatus Omnitrophica bacterium]|nr:hypothetical protein [Candidatus Omnitrophota bacterium]
MKKIFPALLICLFSIWSFPALVFCEENLTITTYYPSPYGSYKELSAHRMKVGINYSGDTVGNNNLVVEGRIGIGTTNPAYGLEVEYPYAASGTEYMLGAFNNSVNAGGIYLGYVGDGVDAFRGRIRSGGNIPLELGTTNYPEALYIRASDGYIGIGTTGPIGKLSVIHDAAAPRPNHIFMSSTSNPNQRLYIGIDSNGGATTGDYAAIQYLQESQHWGPLVLQPSYGNVGIGTTNPSETLHVEGNLYVSGEIHTDSSGDGFGWTMESSAGGACNSICNAAGKGCVFGQAADMSIRSCTYSTSTRCMCAP